MKLARVAGWCALVLTAACASVPSVVRREMANSKDGMATVVFFTDFQCPFCRRTHKALADAARTYNASHASGVRVVLRHVPLSMHPYADGAARAAVCAESLPAYTAFVEALASASSQRPEACEALAVRHGADASAFRACVVDTRTAERVRFDTAMFDDVHGDGVPLLYVGTRRLSGEQTNGDIEQALEK
jgi:protein-disulfide isomerase